MSLADDIRAAQTRLDDATAAAVEEVRGGLGAEDRSALAAALSDPRVDDEALVAVLLARGFTGVDRRTVARYRRAIQ